MIGILFFCKLQSALEARESHDDVESLQGRMPHADHGQHCVTTASVARCQSALLPHCVFRENCTPSRKARVPRDYVIKVISHFRSFCVSKLQRRSKLISARRSLAFLFSFFFFYPIVVLLDQQRCCTQFAALSQDKPQI